LVLLKSKVDSDVGRRDVWLYDAGGNVMDGWVSSGNEVALVRLGGGTCVEFWFKDGYPVIAVASGPVVVGEVPVAVEFDAAELDLYPPVRLPPVLLNLFGVEVVDAFWLYEGVMLGEEVTFTEGTMEPLAPVPETTVVPPDIDKLADPEGGKFDGVNVAFDEGTIVPEVVRFAVGVLLPDPPVEKPRVLLPESETLKAPEGPVVSGPVVAFVDVSIAIDDVALLLGGVMIPVLADE
jgi:hypothetical protein